MGETKRFVISGVCCSTEEAVLRKCLNASLGAEDYDFIAATSELVVHGPLDEQQVIWQVRRAGFDARARREPATAQTFWQRHAHGIYAGTAAVLTVSGILLESAGGMDGAARAILLAAVVTGGWNILLKAVKAIRAQALDMNVLMSVAVLGALAIGKWSEGAAVIVLFSLSLMLETYSAARTRRAVQSLLALAPEQARVEQDGKEVMVASESVSPGMLVRVRPGDRIPLDGVVVEGRSEVNESAVTGESTPLEKSQGHQVFAGSLNGRGTLTVRATRRFEDTTLARILHLIEEAYHKRAPVQLFVDRFAAIYAPVVLGGAVMVALLPPIAFGGSLEEWLYRALVMLVIACPCALVISTPVTLVSALTNAARRGILVKGGKHLETLSAVTAMAFDKTGTLTEGKPRVTDIHMIRGQSAEGVLRLIAGIERQSEHHLAAAVVVEAERRGVEYHSLAVRSFEALPGLGVKAAVDGTLYYLGNSTLAEAHGLLTDEVRTTVQRFTHEGKTTIIFGCEGDPLCVLAARDTARHQGRDALARLREMGIQEIVLLSGDHSLLAERAAADLGVATVRAGLLPQDKVTVIQELKRGHRAVAMVGDGINDAPALMASSVGIAMGVAGSDAALETADVVLMADDLSRLPHLFGLSRKAVAIVRQNITLALALKALFLILSLLGYSTLWMAVLADDGAALAVILNGLRLLSFTEGESHA